MSVDDLWEDEGPTPTLTKPRGGRQAVAERLRDGELVVKTVCRFCKATVLLPCRVRGEEVVPNALAMKMADLIVCRRCCEKYDAAVAARRDSA